MLVQGQKPKKTNFFAGLPEFHPLGVDSCPNVLVKSHLHQLPVLRHNFSHGYGCSYGTGNDPDGFQSQENLFAPFPGSNATDQIHGFLGSQSVRRLFQI